MTPPADDGSADDGSMAASADGADAPSGDAGANASSGDGGADTSSGDDGDGTPGGDDGAETGRFGLVRLLPGPIRRRYAAKFVLALLVVVLVVSVVGGLSYVQTQAIIQDDAEATLRSAATLQADSVTEWVAGLRTQTAALSTSTVLTGGDRTAIDAYLADSLDVATDDVVGLHLVDRSSGRIIASTTNRFRDETLADRSPAWADAVANATEGTVGTSEAAFEREGRLLMAFASGTRDPDRVLVLVGDVGADLEQLHESSALVTTRILNAEGRGVFEPRQNTPSSLVDDPAFEAALNGETRIIERETNVVALSPVEGADWVVVTEAPRADLYAASRTVGRNVLVLVGATLLTLTVVGLLLARSTVVPLKRLRERARSMEGGDLDVDLETDREDEIGRLFRAFANMRDALRAQIEAANAARESAEASQRELERQNERLAQFAGTVSHDLRNPLSVADGQRELLAMALEDEDLDRAELTGRVEAIADAHNRLDRIIQDVLALARGEDVVEDRTRVALSAVAEEAWANVDTADATLEVAGETIFEADRGRLLRVFENLFRNAVEHAGPSVTVTVEPTDDGFAVADDGPGIPAEEAGAVFEYGHSGTGEGTGLGLSIVRTIVEAHGWSVDVDTDHAGGARFVVSGVTRDAVD